SCNGGSNGSATVIAAGGTTPYTYSWSPSGGVNSMATGLTAGTYTVTVLDANGCQAFTTAPAITQPALIVITTAASGVSCFGGNDGSASASSSGGVSGYNYTWLPGGTTGNTISGLSASTYTVQVTDANNCVQTATFVINPAIQLVSSIFASSNVSCFGGNNGTATVNVSGGAPFYNYSWSPLGGNGPTGAGLAAGSYTVNIVDSKGCTSFSSITITEPTQALAGNGTSVSTSCFGGSDGSASVTPIGGTPGYVYQWNPVGGTGQTALGLTAGNYTVLVTDANGCQTSVLTSVSQPSYSVTGILVPANPSCGLSNGSILSQISGGTGPYSYLWAPGSSTGASISGLGPGSYTLQVTDASCSVKGTFTITLSNIAGPSGVVSLVKNVSCFGGNDGSATVNVTQGTAPYLVNWLPYGGNKLSAASLIAGIYTVNITDALGCTAIATTTITEPAPVVVSVSSATSVSCKNGNNGSIKLTAAGGMPIYNYLWQPLVSSSDIANSLTAGTYTVIVSDQNNCSTSIAIKITEPPIMLSSIGSITNPTCSGGNGSATVISAGGTTPYSYMWSTAPAQTGNSATLSAGSYTVTTTDANGCTITTTAVISEPAQVITTAGPNDTVCIGQSINLTATASGGAGNYQYVWQPSGAINGGTLNVTPSVNTTYTVIAYDQNGCAGTPGIISAAVYSLTPGNVMAIGFSPICPGQSSTVYVQT
ncbi:MAG: SprB repeat-containing protein, partial [Bacteroidetes bacterium]|nr:SprB repeat-containing protein [Bacteroidota bacterium]